ncbi:MAG: hypothetical protein ACYTFO_03910 [Planctomycetota bacterium]|jgi:cell division protein FtsI/penicillin-binding protein 2
MPATTGTSSVDTRLGRLNLVFVLLLLAPAALAVHLAVVLRHADASAAQQVASQQRMVVPIPARPGGIWARNRSSYRLLAGSRQSPACFIDPAIIPDEQVDGVAAELAAALSMSPSEVLQIIAERRDKRFAWIKHDLTNEEAAAVRQLNRLAVGIQHEWRREYPNGPLAATVLGFCRRDGQPGGGLELSQYPWLEAADGQEVLLADAKRRPIQILPDECVAPAGH